LRPDKSGQSLYLPTYLISQRYMEKVAEKDLVFAKHPWLYRQEEGVIHRIKEWMN